MKKIAWNIRFIKATMIPLAMIIWTIREMIAQTEDLIDEIDSWFDE